jgi:cell wall-associated NlpC family hydrolase
MSRTFIVVKYLGIPYKNKGRDIIGLDCWGLVMMIYRDILKIDLPDTVDQYGVDWSWKGKDYFRENYTDKWERIEKPRLMDIILLKNNKGIPNHAGVMLDERNFIQCTKIGVILSRMTDKEIMKRTEGFFRYKT